MSADTLPYSGEIPVRPVASIAAALALAVVFVGASVAVAEPAVIGPPPTVSRPRTSSSNTVTKAEAQAQLTAQLTAQRRSYERQIAALKAQLAKTRSEVANLDGAYSLKDQEIVDLTSQNESVRADYEKLLETQSSNLAKIAYLTAHNEELAAAVEGTRPPIGRDWFDWAVLGLGAVLGGLIGLFFGIRRGEDRAGGGGIPADAAAWWGESERPKESLKYP
jgi:hypothetical protein